MKTIAGFIYYVYLCIIKLKDIVMKTEAFKILINGFVWWYRDKHIYEFKHSKIGLYIYSKHITDNERKQILAQI